MVIWFVERGPCNIQFVLQPGSLHNDNWECKYTPGLAFRRLPSAGGGSDFPLLFSLLPPSPSALDFRQFYSSSSSANKKLSCISCLRNPLLEFPFVHKSSDGERRAQRGCRAMNPLRTSFLKRTQGLKTYKRTK